MLNKPLAMGSDRRDTATARDSKASTSREMTTITPWLKGNAERFHTRTSVTTYAGKNHGRPPLIHAR